MQNTQQFSLTNVYAGKNTLITKISNSVEGFGHKGKLDNM